MGGRCFTMGMRIQITMYVFAHIAKTEFFIDNAAVLTAEIAMQVSVSRGFMEHYLFHHSYPPLCVHSRHSQNLADIRCNMLGMLTRKDNVAYAFVRQVIATLKALRAVRFNTVYAACVNKYFFEEGMIFSESFHEEFGCIRVKISQKFYMKIVAIIIRKHLKI